MIPLLHLTRDPWGLPPRVEISGGVEGPERGTMGLPRIRIHVQRWSPDNWLSARRRRPTDAWGSAANASASPATAGVTTPGDVLSYRGMWDEYVLGVVRALQASAAAWTAVASGQAPALAVDASLGAADTPAAAAAKAAAYAGILSSDADALLWSWNQYAGLGDQDFVLRAADILQSEQTTVLQAGAGAEKCRKYCPGIALPETPGIELQARIIGQLEGAGVLGRGILHLLGVGASGALQTMGDVLQGAGRVVDTLTNPWIVGLACLATVAVSAAVLLPRVKSAA